ncbi:MAG: GxxExxY protein [candidate division KSB1 bacterium]|nr:GxxExxY protein [candidate division KSB1 bacterium]MDZ7369232.1 GxxExxY protein [candidate division KSB1 bacterium]MDZ7407234.1 GxxExxY protein [candidate division KSB1 bacterium]
MAEENEFLHKELSYEVIGCAFDTFKTVGVGFSEAVYHKFFHDRLMKKGFKTQYKVPAHLNYQSKRIADFEIDEIVEDKIVVELKEIQTDFMPENYAQIITYLKLTSLRLGLLINFGLHKAFAKRVIFDNRREKDTESWDQGFWKDSSKQSIVDAIIAAISNVDRELGAGYHSQIYKTAVGIELKQNQIACNDKVHINFNFENIQLNPFEIDHWLIKESILLGVLAGKDEPRAYDLLRTR